MGKNVAVFVDVANIFYAAKAAGVDIDYVTLLKSATVGRDLVRAYAYTGLDPDNENQRNFHTFLARHGYKVVSKDIRKYGDGKVKANLDIELVVDLLRTARNLDIAIVVSGDGDFAPAIRAVQQTGVRVEVISFRGNTSSDLIDVADQFTDITALAKVEKGSSRSGRRVADDDEDLSMTEVPDKQTEGSGGRGSRGRGRGRTRGEEGTRARRGATRTTAAGRPAAARSAGRVGAGRIAAGGAPIVALPGEKLSRLGGATATLDQGEDEATARAGMGLEEPSEIEVFTGEGPGGEPGDDSAPRRRRRRGGRGRGRGRGRGEGEGVPAAATAAAADAGEAGDAPGRDEEDEFVETPRAPRPTPFGSVWDSQLGMPTQVAGAGAGPSAPAGEDEDLEEPAIPEYLIAERRARGRGGMPAGRGGRGARGAYAAAIDRERYGRGGGGGINRYPDVSGRERREGGFQRPDRGRPDRGRPVRPEPRGERPRPDRPGGRGGEPWSEVPPELEAMLRAQLSVGRHREAEAPPSEVVPAPADAEPLEAVADTVGGSVESEGAPKPTTRRRTASTSTAGKTPAKRTARRKADGEESSDSAPKRRTTKRAAAAAGEGATKARTTRRKTTGGKGSAGDSPSGGTDSPAE